ncbi:11694_t:CDS:10, partial [Ambispora gerdemannii]
MVSVNFESTAVQRPPIVIYSHDGSKTEQKHALPAVFRAPIRPDIVNAVHTSIAKNKRQPYAVSKKAGHQTSAESWGTGRAVARIPRVSGGGTHRAGQGAFGNMCRGGRMFAPTKIWRKWHVKTNLNQKRYATASALAASSVPPLVLARGHRIEEIAEIPLVVSNDIESLAKTRAAVALLKAVNAYRDVVKVSNSRKLRAGKGKMRNRRHRQRRGPLIVYNEDHGVVKAFRNIPGVELVNVRHLNLLLLAPGGHLGRFIIWSHGAFALLDDLYGTYQKPASLKKDYRLPSHIISSSDVTRIINSTEIQSVLRPAGEKHQKRPYTQKKNPLRNNGVLIRLNPYAKVLRRAEILNAERRAANKITKKKRPSKSTTKASKKNQDPKFSFAPITSTSSFPTQTPQTSPPPPKPILTSDNLFYPLSRSPIPDIQNRAKIINTYGTCPICISQPQQQQRQSIYECPGCGYPTHCSKEHYEQDIEEHRKVCVWLREANEDEHDLRSGRKMTEFDFPGEQDLDQRVNMLTWDTYFYTRNFPSLDEDRSLRHVTKPLTYPVTMASVLHESGPYSLRNRLTSEGLKSLIALQLDQVIRIMVVGARAEAQLPADVYNEICHLFPDNTFHIHFIGPESLPPPSFSPSPPQQNRDEEKGEKLSPFSTITKHYGPRLSFTWAKQMYHDYHESMHPFDPYTDVFFLFSPGFAQPNGKDFWGKTLKKMLATKCAIFVTGYDEEDMLKGDETQQEADTNMDQDSDLKNNIKKDKTVPELDWLLTPGRNVFRSLKRDIDLQDVRKHIFTNWGIYGIRGKRGTRAEEDERDEVAVEEASPITTHPCFHVHSPLPRVVTPPPQHDSFYLHRLNDHEHLNILFPSNALVADDEPPIEWEFNTMIR